MVAAASRTWAQTRLCQLSRCVICIHAIYACMRVETPHCRAFSTIARMGRRAVRIASSSRRMMRCGRLSTSRMSRQPVLSFTATHFAHQNSKSWRIRSISNPLRESVSEYSGSRSIEAGTHALPPPGTRTSRRSPQHPSPDSGSYRSVASRWRRRSFSLIIAV